MKLGIFFSHPTQHHSAMFRCLTKTPGLEVKVFYYDPGLAGQMYDSGYGTSEKWDVDLLSGTNTKILWNPFRGREVSMVRQFNPGAIAVILREKFDAVFVAGYASPTNWLVLLAAKLTGAKVFYQSDTNVLDLRRKPSSKLKDLVRKLFFGGVHSFLAIGDKNREAHLSQGVPESRIAWCPYPVDGARYEAARRDSELPARLAALRKKFEVPEAARIVVFCGKLISRKRPGDLVEALRFLKREDVYGLLIGSGELEAELRRSLRPDDCVRITGFVNQSQIPYHMLLGDVGVVTSEWDPHPLVTTEFAMCGLPVLASDYCGVWGEHDILRPGENGFVYRCGDIEALAKFLKQLLDNEPLRQRFGQRSLELSRDQSAEHTASLVAQLVCAKR